MTLIVNNMSKIYKEKKALDNIQLTFNEKTIYGLLGRNGAGKSTLLNIINNRSFPTQGTVSLDGQTVTDNEKALNYLYLMSEDNLFPAQMKVKKMMETTAEFFGDFDWFLANRMIDAFELDTKQLFRKLSTGYRSIAKLIIALSIKGRYIFLDEPVLGLDANHRKLFNDFLIETYEERPRTFVISTHLIEEISSLIEEVIIIDKGAVLKTGSIDKLLMEGNTISGPKELVESYIKGLDVINTEYLGNYMNAYVSESVLTQIPEGLTISPLSLQSYFVQLTQRKKEN